MFPSIGNLRIIHCKSNLETSEYITLQMPDGSQGQTMVLAQEGAEGEQGEQGIYSGLTNFFSKYFCTYDFTIF